MKKCRQLAQEYVAALSQSRRKHKRRILRTVTCSRKGICTVSIVGPRSQWRKSQNEARSSPKPSCQTVTNGAVWVPLARLHLHHVQDRVDVLGLGVVPLRPRLDPSPRCITRLCSSWRCVRSSTPADELQCSCGTLATGTLSTLSTSCRPPLPSPRPTSSPWGPAWAWVARGDTRRQPPEGSRYACPDRLPPVCGQGDDC